MIRKYWHINIFTCIRVLKACSYDFESQSVTSDACKFVDILLKEKSMSTESECHAPYQRFHSGHYNIMQCNSTLITICINYTLINRVASCISFIGIYSIFD